MAHRLKRRRRVELAASPATRAVADSRPRATSSHLHSARPLGYRRQHMRLPLALIAVIALGAGASAFAQGGGPEPTEPEITAVSVLRLTSAQGCVSPSRITVRAAPPAGVELELLRVAVEGRLATRMAGVRGRASVTVSIPRG